jgi:hypothetical protein
MRLSIFLMECGIGGGEVFDAIKAGSVEVINAGSTTPSRISTDTEIGYGDKVRIRLLGKMRTFHYANINREITDNRMPKSSGKIGGLQVFFLSLTAVVSSIAAIGFLANVYPGPQWRAEKLADDRQAEFERLKQEEISRQNSIRFEREREVKEAENRRRQAEREAEEQKKSNIPMGVSVSVKDDRKVTVTNAVLYDYLSTGNSLVDPISGDGGKILVVYISIENTGKESGDMAWSIFRAEDNDGNTYDEIKGAGFALSIWRDSQGFGDSGDQLYPGQSKSIAKVFRVRNGASGLKLKVNDYKFIL